MNLPADQGKVLRFLAKGSIDFGIYPFRTISAATRLNRRRVRLACRALARKGLAEFAKGCCNDYGDFTGSGYGATDAGRALVGQS